MARKLVFVAVALLASDVVAQPSAQIHWRDVPLRDAISRLESLFEEPVFLDRRVDVGQRVSLDITAYALVDALEPLAKSCGLEIGRFGGLFYLGPQQLADRLATLATLREQEVQRLPPEARLGFEVAAPVHWARLSEPRSLIVALVENRGWQVSHAERIPHDLWVAGGLPAMPLSDQLTILLFGFDRTFVVNADERTLEIVPIDEAVVSRLAAEPIVEDDSGEPASPERRATERQGSGGARQVYSLRVAEQPVSAVLKEFTRRLNWRIQIDDKALRAASRSVDARVSFAVENVGEDELLEALLRPAGLTFRRDGEVIVITPRDSD